MQAWWRGVTPSTWPKVFTGCRWNSVYAKRCPVTCTYIPFRTSHTWVNMRLISLSSTRCYTRIRWIERRQKLEDFQGQDLEVIRVIDYDGVTLCLRTAATNGPIVHPPGDMWAWIAMMMMMMMMPAGDNSFPVHQSSLTVLRAETSGASRRNGRKSENFAYQYLKYLKGSFNMT
jgi:hypothetical protein